MSSPPVTSLPAYLGLFASLVLAIACNGFLDIGYGIFGIEVTVWAAAYGTTLGIAWRQQGRVDDSGVAWQKSWLIIGLLASVLLFLPLWGLPRAGLYALAALQAAANCVTVDRRKFMMALLVSAVMAMFATMHWRADWTMMFYLLPYLFAVVFTLVAEQVGRRLREARQEGSAQGVARGQIAAIFAATTTLLVIALAIFAITPRVTVDWVHWQYGQLVHKAKPQSKEKGGDGGPAEPGGTSAGGVESSSSGGGDGIDGQGDQDIANGQARGIVSGLGYRESSSTLQFPTPGELREAANRSGMPAWQAAVMKGLAGVIEQCEMALAPVGGDLDQAVRQGGEWLEAHRKSIVRISLLLLLLALLVAVYLLQREARVGLWLGIQVDYLRFGQFGLHSPGQRGARQFFGAVERFFAFRHIARAPHLNAREYMALVVRDRPGIQAGVAELVCLFENARYGPSSPSSGDLARMRTLYRQIFRQA